MPPEPDPFAATPQRSRAEFLVCSIHAETPSAAETIAAAGKLIGRIRGDAALAALLDAHGCDASALDAGVALLTAAEEQFGACERELIALQAARRELDAIWVATREEYLEFRATVRTEVADLGQRRELGVHGLIAGELPQFVAQATRSYAAVECSANATILARRSFDRARVLAALQSLAQLRQLHALVEAAQERLKRVADERQLAAAMLSLWVGELLHTFRTAFGETKRPPSNVCVSRNRPETWPARFRASRRPRLPRPASAG